MEIALIGIAGTLLGIVTTYLLNLRAERVKKDLDKKLHFDEARAVAYAEFMSTAAKAFDEWLNYHHHARTSNNDATTLDALVQEVRETHHESWTPFQKVKILSTKPVATAAGAVWEVLRNVRNGNYSESELKRNMGDAEDRFISAVKIELGLE